MRPWSGRCPETAGRTRVREAVSTVAHPVDPDVTPGQAVAVRTARAPGVEPAELFGDAAIQDPYPLYDRLREAGPVHPVGDSGFYLVCGWDAVNEAVARVDDFSSNLTATMAYADGVVEPFTIGELDGPIHALATADEPAHTVHRRMLLPRLAAKRIHGLEPVIAGIFDDRWAGHLAGGRIEWMSAVADRLPMTVVTRLIGIPDADVDMLIPKIYASMQLLDGLVPADELSAATLAAAELSGYIFQRFRRTLDEGARDDLLGDLATAYDAGEVDDTTAAVMMVTLFSAGGESTASLLGSAVGILVENPGIQRRLRADPGLLGAFIEETLRFETPFRGHYRHVRADTELGGVALPAGARLLLLWGAANRDPAHFDDPAEFRLDRADGARGHLTFGRGAHFCVGAALARLEARVVLGALLARTSWIDAAGVGPWLPSVSVRRRSRLELTVQE